MHNENEKLNTHVAIVFDIQINICFYQIYFLYFQLPLFHLHTKLIFIQIRIYFRYLHVSFFFLDVGNNIEYFIYACMHICM